MDHDAQLMQARLSELAQIASKQDRTVFSRFLSLADLSVLLSLSARLPVGFKTWGGHADCERKMAAFLPYPDTEVLFPIVCLHIRPRSMRFAQDLSHRDFLGSLIGLGITRDVIGDLFVKNSAAFVFVTDEIAPFICRELSKVSRTDVDVSLCEEVPDSFLPRPVPVRINLASCRLDALVGAVYHLSRGNASALITQKRVFVNARCIENTSYAPKEGAVISVRGYGRFRFDSVTGETKKGRLQALVSVYGA